MRYRWKNYGRFLDETKESFAYRVNNETMWHHEVDPVPGLVVDKVSLERFSKPFAKWCPGSISTDGIRNGGQHRRKRKSVDVETALALPVRSPDRRAQGSRYLFAPPFRCDQLFGYSERVAGIAIDPRCFVKLPPGRSIKISHRYAPPVAGL